MTHPADSPVPLDVGAARALLERVIEILETEDISELRVGERRELIRHLGSLAASLSGLEAAQRDAERMDASEREAPNDEACALCHRFTSSLAGDPGRWPIRLGFVNGNGETRVYCQACVMRAVAASERPTPASDPQPKTEPCPFSPHCTMIFKHDGPCAFGHECGDPRCACGLSSVRASLEAREAERDRKAFEAGVYWLAQLDGIGVPTTQMAKYLDENSPPPPLPRTVSLLFDSFRRAALPEEQKPR